MIPLPGPTVPVAARGAGRQADAIVSGQMDTAEQYQRAEQKQREETDGDAAFPHGLPSRKLHDVADLAVRRLLKTPSVILHDISR